jgi:hypothetical protein
VLDAYSRRARLAPALLAALPPLTLLGGGAVSPVRAASILAITFGGVALVVCGVVRDAGRGLQPQLWESWGGAPTLRRLRWRGATDVAAVTRLHARLGEVWDQQLPTQTDEDDRPEEADQLYAEAVAALRELTRDRKRCPLVFEENVEYGFRRNCLGLRRVALVLAAATVGIGVVLALTSAGPHPIRFWAPAAVGLIALVAWYRLVTPAWVRTPGELYADRLLEAIESLRRQNAG